MLLTNNSRIRLTKDDTYNEEIVSYNADIGEHSYDTYITKNKFCEAGQGNSDGTYTDFNVLNYLYFSKSIGASKDVAYGNYQ